MRLTRAKAAALAGPDDQVPTGLAKKPLQSKKSAVNVTVSSTAPAQKKRPALGDRSNIVKNETVEVKEGKKATVGRPALVSKATTQNAGVQKSSKAASTRSMLEPKDPNKSVRRPISEQGGTMGGAAKKRRTNSNASRQVVKEETPQVENEPPKEDNVAIEIERRPEDKRKVVKEEAPKYETHEVKQPMAENEKQQTKKEPKHSIVEDVSQSTVADDVRRDLADAVQDLDDEDLEDPLMVAEYVVEIFDYLREIEEATMANPSYMDLQEDLEWKQRGILVDWLIEVHTRFHLLPETLFLAVNIIDRFLSTKVVQLQKLQLVGITAMFIASKYEEVLSPHVQNFRHVADDGFTEAEILSAERYILAALNYDLSYPNPMNFLRRISKADNYEIQSRTLGKYFLEIGLVDHRFIEYAPSHIAAASMYLARLILERGDWVSNTVLHYVSLLTC